MTLFTDVTFLQVCLAVLSVAVAERLFLTYLPEDMVGPDGWLLKTGKPE
jgi:hypothetical protein